MANNIGRIRIFGAEIVVKTAEYQPSHSYLRAFTPATVSFGGGFLGDKHVQEDVRRGAKFCAIVDHVDTSSRFSILDDYYDDVDTTLRLSTSVSTKFGPPVLCPMPLRCFPPGIVPTEADFWFGGYDVEISATDQVGKTMSLSNAGSRISGEEREKSRKRKHDRVGDEKKTRSVKRKRDNSADDHQDLYPIASVEDNIPGLLLVQIIESRNGTSPVFLYRKRLEQTDVSGHHNRLFVNRREKFMEFLTDEEKTALNQCKQGLEVFAVDPQGKLYKLGLKIWQSLKMMVVNSDWNKFVVGNNAQKGDWIQIWGYRDDEKLRFAINLRKSEA